ncbi:beta-glucosidase [Pyrenochaeta sp. MPI-SDFR-AT-0127]|nr:beta-glucosidase [Pyrenochaeta sp. MPI-SDFR-AT-0127]
MQTLDVEDVISRLELDEKISLLSGGSFWGTKSIPRLKVPALRFSDGPNGVRGIRFWNGPPAACLPCGTALGATWDTDLLEEAGRLMGTEAIVKGVHVSLGPTINMQRSPIGGRGFESYSEDPVLAGNMATAIVNGVQSKGVASCIKHFVCNDIEHERQAIDCRVSERALREIYLMPFQIAQRDAKPKAYMTSYNKINGLHVSENKRLLQDVLRNEWGFDGFIMSDWFGTYSAAESTKAGLDIEMPGPPRVRGPNITVSLGNRKIAEHEVDDRVRNLLNLVNRVAPLNIEEHATEGQLEQPAEVAPQLRKLAADSIVLLKNEHSVLPLDKSKSIAVIGPNAKVARYSGGGSASLKPYWVVTPFEGIVQHAPDAKYAEGATNYKQLPILSRLTKTIDGRPGCIAKFYNEPYGADFRVCQDEIYTDVSEMLLVDYAHPNVSSELFYMDLECTFTPDVSGEYEFGCSVRGTAKLYIDGQLVVDNATKQRQGSTFLGAGTLEERGSQVLEEGKTYHVVLQFGSSLTQKVKKKGATAMRGGGVRLGGCLKVDPDTELQMAVELAKEVDQVVICAGLSGEWEGEGFDRPDMDLPGLQNRLISAIAAVNSHTVVVNQSGTPVTMPWIHEVPALIQAWYGGNETGNGIGDVLFGVVNPSGKLSLSFPVRNEDNPAFLNQRSEKGKCVYGEDVYIGYRFYERTKRDVLFPFGYGLSYTTFFMTDLCVDSDTSTLRVSLKVRNGGNQDGAEVVQVYISQIDCPITRPPKELKGFKKVFLLAGDEKRIEIRMQTKYATSYWDEERDQWASESGEYVVRVGNSSDKTLLMGSFKVAKTSWWRGL